MTSAPVASPASSTAASATVRWALRHPASHARLWVAALAGLVLDLWSKHWAFETLSFSEPQVVLPGALNLQLSLNPGALFGIGAGWAPIFVGASVLALFFVLYLFANSTAARWTLHVALGLVLAGAVGNLYDRATQEAFVVDDPRAGRDIGQVLERTSTQVVLGDYGSGGNPRVRPLTDSPRSGYQPVVRDFLKIELHVGEFAVWPWIFNVADALLVIGVSVLLVNFWFEHRHHARSAASTD